MSLNKSFLALVASALLLASCGQTHKAKSSVKEFMNEQMQLQGYDVLAWSKLDSTFRVTDSALIRMHNQAVQRHVVKAGTKYAPRTNKLFLLTVRYKLEGDTLMNTFYLDDNATGIVGVKKD